MITSHVLDTVQGKPATGVVVRLFRCGEPGDTLLGEARTDLQGRIASFGVDLAGQKGNFRLRFEVATYFAQLEMASLYPYVDITFVGKFPGHYHIPLILSAHGYSTYRGS
jgi:5-hydroxyisourate hydrolase